jgi:GNAT superfamily N-acetyltransferase
MLHLRAATAADYDTFARFWAQLGIDQPLLGAAYYEAHVAPFAMFLAADDGQLAAYGLCFPIGTRGDVRQIVVDHAWRRRGVGRQLLAAVRAKLVAAGCRDWRLEVAADNAGAIALYESAGMRKIHEIRDLKMAWPAVARFAGPRSARWLASEVAPAEDAALEAHFDYGAGQLQQWRTTRPHVPLWSVRNQGVPVGLTRFWRDYLPDSGLCFPFRAASPDIAAHLLHGALRGQQIPQLELSVVDPGVADALVEAGARDHQRLYEMGGSLDS